MKGDAMGNKILSKLKGKNFLLLFLAGCINAVGVTMFLAPVNLYDSGFSGTSMLLWQITPDEFSLAFFLLVLNLPFFLFGLRRQGVQFTVYAVFAVVVYSAASYLITDVLPIEVASASPFAGQDLLLCAVFGGLISGVGSGLTIRCGGAIDGVEVLAVIFAKGMGITVGTFVMIYNVLLYIVIGVITRSWVLPLYSILTYCAAIKTMDFIVEGLDKAKSAMIVTGRPQEVCDALSAAFGHGITQMDARGYYSNQARTVIYFVVNRFQIGRLTDIVRDIDPTAFVTIAEVSDVFGSSLKEK